MARLRHNTGGKLSTGAAVEQQIRNSACEWRRKTEGALLKRKKVASTREEAMGQGFEDLGENESEEPNAIIDTILRFLELKMEG